MEAKRGVEFRHSTRGILQTTAKSEEGSVLTLVVIFAYPDAICGKQRKADKKKELHAISRTHQDRGNLVLKRSVPHFQPNTSGGPQGRFLSWCERVGIEPTTVKTVVPCATTP